MLNHSWVKTSISSLSYKGSPINNYSNNKSAFVVYWLIDSRTFPTRVKIILEEMSGKAAAGTKLKNPNEHVQISRIQFLFVYFANSVYGLRSTLNQNCLEVSWNSSKNLFTVQLVVLYSLHVKILLRPTISSYGLYSAGQHQTNQIPSLTKNRTEQSFHNPSAF